MSLLRLIHFEAAKRFKKFRLYKLETEHLRKDLFRISKRFFENNGKNNRRKNVSTHKCFQQVLTVFGLAR